MSGPSGSRELVAACPRVHLGGEGFSRAEASLDWPQRPCPGQDCIKHITGDKEGPSPLGCSVEGILIVPL